MVIYFTKLKRDEREREREGTLFPSLKLTLWGDKSILMEQKTFSLAWHFPENSFQADSATGIVLRYSSITADTNVCGHHPLEKQGSQPTQEASVPSHCGKWTPPSDRKAWWQPATDLKGQMKTWPIASLTSPTIPKASVLFWVWFLMFCCFVYLQREQINNTENYLIGPLGIAKPVVLMKLKPWEQ